MLSRGCFQSTKGAAQSPGRSSQPLQPQVLLSLLEHQLVASCSPLRYVPPLQLFPGELWHERSFTWILTCCVYSQFQTLLGNEQPLPSQDNVEKFLLCAGGNSDLADYEPLSDRKAGHVPGLLRSRLALFRNDLFRPTRHFRSKLKLHFVIDDGAWLSRRLSNTCFHLLSENRDCTGR